MMHIELKNEQTKVCIAQQQTYTKTHESERDGHLTPSLTHTYIEFSSIYFS